MMKTNMSKHSDESSYSLELVKVAIVALVVTLLIIAAVKLISTIVSMFI